MKIFKSFLAVILVIASLLTLAACGGGSGATTSDTSSAATSSGASADSGRVYTKGSVIDGVYINNWAGLQFVTNDEWVACEKDIIKSYEVTNVSCGFVAGAASSGKQLAICVEKLPAEEDVAETSDASSDASEEVSKVEFTIDGYLDSLVTGFSSTVAESTFGEYRDITVAGEKYRAVDIVLGESVYQTICARRNGNHCIVLIATGIEKEIPEQALALLTVPTEE